METLHEKLKTIPKEHTPDQDPTEDDQQEQDQQESSSPTLNVSVMPQDELPSLEDVVNRDKEISRFKDLFHDAVFWLSREVPRYSLEFVIRCFGGRVGWDATSGSGSPYQMDDPRITHHIMDRTGVSDRMDGREYLQPQWVYDSINAQQFVKTEGYHPGETLPPHLSPFKMYTADDYIPEEANEHMNESDVSEQEVMVNHQIIK